ncbi:MAG: 6-phosphogluconolactonase [archaeon]
MIDLRGTRGELERKAARIIERTVADIGNGVVLGLCGGRSVPGVFSELAKRDIDWGRVQIFMVDERMVPVDDAESNFGLVKGLIDRIKIPAENVHPFRAEQGIAGYEEELKLHGGRYDVVLLSSGEDGHIGALYPEHHSIEDESEFFIEMDDSPKPPPRRMSMSRKLLLKADTGILLFFGKADAYGKFVAAEDFRKCPAALVKSLPRPYVLADVGGTGFILKTAFPAISLGLNGDFSIQ